MMGNKKYYRLLYDMTNVDDIEIPKGTLLVETSIPKIHRVIPCKVAEGELVGVEVMCDDYELEEI